MDVVTAVTEPARTLDVRAWLTEAARREHLHRELLQRQIRGMSTGPSYLIEQTAREIRDTTTVERWLGQQLRELSGGEQ